MKKRLPLLTGVTLSLAIHGGLLVWQVPHPTRKPPPAEPLLPSAIALRQAVREATGTGGADAAAGGCSPLQSRNELLDCAPLPPDWQASGRLHPQATRAGFAATVARGRAVAGTLASNRSQWLVQLDHAEVDERTRRNGYSIPADPAAK